MKGLQQVLAWFQTLEARERFALLAGGGALLLTLLFLGVVEPLWQYRAQLESRVGAQRELVAWMRGAANVLQQRGPSRQPVAQGSASLLATTDSSARAAGLAGALQRIQQDGDDAVRVRLEAANFDAFILWLDELERRSGIVATDVALDRGDAIGLVDVSLTLARAGS